MSAATGLISVILPVCNGDEHLRAALDSVQSQTHRALEILAVDDGSTDGSGRILRDRAAADPRVRVFTQTNHGVSVARNRALTAARGEWVVFLDADDMFVDPRLFEMLVLAGGQGIDILDFATTSTEPRDSRPPVAGEIASAGGIASAGEIAAACGIASAASLRVAACSREIRLDHRRLAEMIAEESANAIWGRAYRRSLLERTGSRFREGLRMGEDLLFNLDCLPAARGMRELPVIGYFYRRTGSASATNRYLPEKFRDLTLVGDRLGEWARGTGSVEVIAAAEFIRAKNVLSCMRDLHHADCDIPRRHRAQTARTFREQVPKVDVRGLRRDRRLLAAVYNLLGYRTMFRLSGLIGALR